VAGRQRRHTQLLNNLEEEKKRYSKLKRRLLDRTPWKAGFGKGYGPNVRLTNE
jgi:hypothetical protein